MIETKTKTIIFRLKKSSPDEVAKLFFDLVTEFVNKLDNCQHTEKDDNGKEYVHSFWKIPPPQDGQLKIHDAIHPAEGLKPGEETVGSSKNIFALSLKTWKIGEITKTQIEFLPFFEKILLDEIGKMEVESFSEVTTTINKETERKNLWKPWEHLGDATENEKELVRLWCTTDKTQKELAKEILIGSGTIANCLTKLRKEYPKANIPNAIRERVAYREKWILSQKADEQN